jgi:hypothetical protein
MFGSRAIEELKSDLQGDEGTAGESAVRTAEEAPHAAPRRLFPYTAARVLRKIEYSDVCPQM